MIEFHKDGTLPEMPNSIFVFGSNEAGIHGAGAARAAFEKYGAEWGNGHGPMGKSYAIPTKDKVIDTLPIEIVEKYIRTFVDFTHFVESKGVSPKWFVTRIGCGLAGFKDAQIAPMFRGAVNCSFAEEWKPYVSD